MFHASSIARLYANVIHEDIVQYGISEQEIRRGIQIMANVYRPEPTSLQLDSMTAANYNEIGLRCAYLHKYAAFHTALVLDVMNIILNAHKSLFQKLVTAGQFKLCSLGGGPGSDAIGILAALDFAFGSFKKEVAIIDIMENWKLTFNALIQQIIYGEYAIKQNFLPNYFRWSYIGLNLLASMSNSANKAISNANFISMVKFVSAAACQDTEAMVTKIFRVMKPGALVLFIDNAAGGFHQLVKRAARKVGLVTILGDVTHLNHYKYSNNELQAIRFGYTSCCMTTVTVHLLQKPHRNQQIKSYMPNHIQLQNPNAPARIFHEPIPTLVKDKLINTKLHSPNSSISLDKNTNLNKSYYSNKINSAEHNVSPTKNQKLNNGLSKTSLNQVPISIIQTSQHISYAPIPPEPVLPIHVRPSRSSVQSEPNAFHESSNDRDDGCSCCVIS